MEIRIDFLLILIAMLFFWIAYMAGIKKQTWILSGFGESRIRDKDRLARIAGYFFLNSGIFILLNGFISFQGQDQLIPPMILAYGAGVIMYVKKTLL
ncbi:DUF3784 domain-containing protein [Bacillus vallismortis]|uniref:DUF3784 domain-containing protein n=1 Tax=Bacillus vallismortis TaxID=72361 RepID=UPI002090F479|nr:DUF3784 domain-containing protein [Bacillus vallismortis]MCO4851344.1 DUF3784 domain-containing protein [Bacillus vallismortis]